jgi:TM2 domain-containing membrane protein YozV
MAWILHEIIREQLQQTEDTMGSGSCGNILAALASFFIPGLGQLLQGRWILAAFMFLLTALLWLILLGWVIHLWSIIDAAVYKGETSWEDRYRREDYRDRGYYRRVY